MKLKITVVLLMLIPIVLFYSCRNPEKNIPDLKSTVWIYSTAHLPDSVDYLEDNYLKCDSNIVLFNGGYIGKYLTISNDTLIIAFDEQKENIYFEGIIQRQTSDTLILKRLKGSFPLITKSGDEINDESEYITLFNQKLSKKNVAKFEKLSFSSSTCYGTCPEISCEIDNKGNIKFYGGFNASKTGYFLGKVDEKYYREIIESISILNLGNDSLRIAVPVDAPEYRMIVRFDNKSIYYTGEYGSCPFGFYELRRLLLDISEHSQLHQTNDRIMFETKILFPVEEVIDFLPPVIAD